VPAQTFAELARSRPGFETIACTPVALPFWRLRVRVEVLARRRISPLEEFMLRAAVEADPRTRAVQQLLGLDDQTFEHVLSSVVEREWAQVKDLQIILTEGGRTALESGRLERSEERVVSFDYDGLLREPTLLNVPLEPEQCRELGLHELPANPPGAPDELELREKTGALESVIRAAREGRDQEADLLAVKGVLRRERMFRAAMLMSFRDEAGAIQAAPIFDGAVSAAHETSLADPAVIRQLRLRSELRRGRRFDQLIAPELRMLYDASREHDALRIRDEARRASNGTEEAERLKAAVGEQMRALRVRRVGPEEHLSLIRVMAQGAQKRLIICTPDVTERSLERDLMEPIRKLLSRGGEVRILHACEQDAPKMLRTLAADHAGMELLRVSRPPVGTVVRDETLALRTLFPVLAHRDCIRAFRDERGWLISDSEQVRALTAELPAPSRPVDRNQTRPRRSRSSQRRTRHRPARGEGRP
jgi:hypothetical protein